jgi:D-alanyl-D-alanine carboxypeptidase/D-alanyl-D-alanine-endopeptidase (penicillin-binding protein 4)
VREQRHWTARFPVRFLAEIVVLTLLVAAVLSYRFDLGDRWFGWGPADPATEPAAVAPPEGLKLPATAPARRVARPSATVPGDPAEVAATVRPMLRERILGPHVGVLVTDLDSGRILFRSGGAAVTPASTTKLLTSAAALSSLGPMARFRTTVRYAPAGRQLVLVGGGDPFLASSPKAGSASYPDRADVVTLANQTARKLRAMKVRRVRLGFDDSYFSGPAVNSHWPDSYVPEGVVPPISALWVDQGLEPDGFGYVPDPAAAAAEVFRTALGAAGVKVGPQVRRVTAPAAGPEVASVSSAPLGEIVQRTLAVSDNQAAEVLARQVGLAERQEGSFEAGSAAVLEVLRRLGVPVAGNVLYDGSGLSRENLLTTQSLAAVVRLSASADHPDLRQVLTGLPVAGFTGSLAYRFERGPAEARGRVRAKTGTLTGVHGLAGVADDADGARMAFVVVADKVRPLKQFAAQTLIDRIAGALGACTCGVGSAHE